MRVLVTGANGTVGSVIAQRFVTEGHTVLSLVRGDTAVVGQPFRADLTDAAALLEAARGVDLAVHCAASRANDLETARLTNVDGTRHLVDALLAHHCPALVHVSTVSVYDDAAGPDFDETRPTWVDPADVYGFTKAEAERIVVDAVSRGLGAIVLRPTLVLSMHPRSRWGPLAVARARVLDECILPAPEVPYVHVDNLAWAVLLAARTPVKDGRVYNVADGVGDTAEYLEAVYGAAGRPVIPVPAGAPRIRFPSDRIRRELNWTSVDRWGEFIQNIRGGS